MKRLLIALLLAATTAGAAGAREVVVRPGETLWVIAEREIGDGHRWREILAANPGLDPRRIPAGAVLNMPGAEEIDTSEPTGTDASPEAEAAGLWEPVGPSPRALREAAAARVQRTLRAAVGAGGSSAAASDAEAALAGGDPERALRLADAAAEAAGVRRLAVRAEAVGPVQTRSSPDAAWAALRGGERLGPGAWIRTSDRGRATLVAEGVALEAGPSSIVRLAEALRAEQTIVGWDLFVGAAALEAAEGRWGRIASGNASVEASGPARLRAEAGADGTLRVQCEGGEAEVRSGETRRTIRAGEIATLRPSGGISVEASPSLLTLSAPEDGARSIAETVKFTWSAAPNASGYRFRLLDAAGEEVFVDRRVEGAALEISGVPSGTYRWTVAPVMAGGYEGAAPPPRAFSIGEAPPLLSVEPPAVDDAGRLLLAGRTVPGAEVRVGASRAEVDAEGRWSVTLAAPGGVHAVGIAAAHAGARAAALALVALGEDVVRVGETAMTRRAELPLYLHVPEGGRIEISPRTAGDTIALRPGENAVAARLVLDEARAEAEARILLDPTPPRVLRVEATPGLVRPGDPVSIRIEAADDGAGLAETAELEVGGLAEAWAGDIPGRDGVFETVVVTDRSLGEGVLHVRRVTVRDRVGNEAVLTSEAARVEDGRAGYEPTGIWAPILLGLGVAIGTAL